MRRLTLVLGGAFFLASLALAQSAAVAQSNKTVTPKIVTDYKAVQNHLYGLNYRVGTRDGLATPELKGAIAQWRKNRNSLVTGDMTEDEAKQLLAVPLPKAWAAIAYSAIGAHGVVSIKASRDVAEKEVLAVCEKDSRKCSVVAAAGTSCAAVATSAGTADGKPMGAWGSYRPNLAAAKDAATADCKKNAALPDTCTVKEAVCADGKK